MFRLLLIAAAAVGGGVALGRRMLDRRIDERVSIEVEAAQAEAVTELHRRSGEVIRERLAAFAVALGVKSALIGTAVALRVWGPLTTEGLRWTAFGLIAAFAAHDLYRLAPQIPPAWRLARASGWSPRRALKEIVAVAAFKRARTAVQSATAKGPAKVWFALSTHTPHGLSRDIADAVADVAAKTTYGRIRLRVFLAVATAGAMLAAYAAFVALTLGAA